MKSCTRHEIDRLPDLVPTVERAIAGILRPNRIGDARVQSVAKDRHHIVERWINRSVRLS
jgi:hypothetical protein